jgi:hypothetical protein
VDTPIKEDWQMKRMWKHKWVVTGVALVIFLSIGTVAWAATGGDDGTTASMTPANAGAASLAAAATGQANGIDASTINARRAAIKEKAAQFAKRQKALLDLLRDKMSAADQATYDQLVQQANDQRAALEKARADLKATAKDLRDLTRKYLDAESGTTSTTGAGTQ